MELKSPVYEATVTQKDAVAITRANLPQVSQQMVDIRVNTCPSVVSTEREQVGIEANVRQRRGLHIHSDIIPQVLDWGEAL